MAYTTRANHDNKNDNKATINKIMKLRTQKAQLLGFATSADFILDDTMAKTPKAVYALLNTVWTPAVAKAKEEVAELQKLMDVQGKGEKLEPWDWWYYSERLRKAKYNLEEEALRPYFKLENVRQGVFGLASKLYGLKFKKLSDMPVYDPDVEVFEVSDADGSLIGILYTDYFPRAGKRAGAWMNNITDQYKKEGVNHRPIVCNVGNFTKPTSTKPSLLNMDEVETMFHEFGHAIHGLLTQCTYPSLSGTSVSRDFVELPSQVMENWCWEPEVMKTYAKHYKTGDVMPKELMDKIQLAGTFNQGFINTELLAASFLDMDYHSMKDTANFDVNTFEKASLDKIGMIPQIITRYRSSYFNHIFSGEYCAGYYSYTWAAVLDADAFQAFKETGDIYNQKVATSFRKNVLEKGDTKAKWTLETLVFPWLGALPIATITAPDLLATLKRIESRGAHETAHRTKARCGQVFRYAIATGRATRDPAADLRGALAPVVSRNFSSITDADGVGELLRTIDRYSGQHVTRCALKLSPLVFVRPGELRRAQWSEIDFDKAQWRIPAARMKMREEHIVPLSEQALAVLRELHPLTGQGRYLFPSLRTLKEPMSENTVNAALRRMGYDKDTMTGHGFRALASTRLNEMGWAPDVIERQLAHAERNKVRAAYNRASYMAERGKMMQAWADYLDALRNDLGKVVAIKRKAS